MAGDSKGHDEERESEVNDCPVNIRIDIFNSIPQPLYSVLFSIKTICLNVDFPTLNTEFRSWGTSKLDVGWWIFKIEIH